MNVVRVLRAWVRTVRVSMPVTRRGRRLLPAVSVAVAVLVAAVLIVDTPGGGRPRTMAWRSAAGSTVAGAGQPDQGAGQAPPVAGGTGNPRLDAAIARLPRFGPAPPPQPVIGPTGPAAGWYSRVPTNRPVAFLTIDDGWIKSLEARELLAAANVPVTLFLTINAIRDKPDYFRQLQSDKVTIEAHTVTHPSLRGKPYAKQRAEICGSADQLGAWYGRRPVLFRPPFGNKDATTLRAAHDCGMKAVFFWTETVDKGKVRYQVGNRVRPGDVLLMHFRPAFVEDFIAALAAIHRSGLTPALLTDYVR